MQCVTCPLGVAVISLVVFWRFGSEPFAGSAGRSLCFTMAWRSCAVLLRLTGGEASWSSVRGGRWPQSLHQNRGFKKASRKPESRKVEEELEAPHTESPEAAAPRQMPAPPQAPPRSMLSFRRLIKPFAFTVGFTGCSFGSAAIIHYESLKSLFDSRFARFQGDGLERQPTQKRGDFRNLINQWWNSLSQGQKTVAVIIAANTIVFCCWRVPFLQPSMIKYFTANPASNTLCSPMLLSTFSHFSFLHMAANMYVLWSFSTTAGTILGTEDFVAIYLSAGVISTFVSYTWKVATGLAGPSLGASGAIMSILAAVCTKIPEAKLAIVFLPMFTFSAANVSFGFTYFHFVTSMMNPSSLSFPQALKAIIALDTTGVLLGWKFFDHAAHLGGAMFGIWSISSGNSLIVWYQRQILKIWHNLRTRGGSGGGDNRGGGR
ncbi:presenilin-associated rhomboid-like protein, mitochondrial isoform X2 [Antennarius striatus]|uniref:presenilin-associated rhomboid-like protein, mitochondrial isoform X2 n=1 Tax=Antennarius striatus TaxID=241820 RepID=UPI0035AE7B5E